MPTQSANVAHGVATPARDWTGWPAACCLALAWSLLLLPLIGRAEWEDGMENLTVATALEIRWTGHVMTPTLQGVTRLNKPPLMPWLTAACISDRTLAELASHDAAARRAGRSHLALEARLPAHVMSALLILTVYGLGRVLGSRRGALIAAAVCATTFLFGRYMRFEAFDAPLALCTAASQLCLAHWVFRGRRWLGAIGGGLALGVGVLSKGPIILLFAVVPLLLYLPMRARRARRLAAGDWPGAASTGVDDGGAAPDDPDAPDGRAAPRGPWLLPVIVLVALTVLPVLPWVWAVTHQEPGAWARWYAEVTRTGTTAAAYGAWYTYANIVLLAAPWTAWIVAGGVLARRDWRRGAGRQMLPVLWALVPLLVLSAARDRKPHYLLPLVAPLALLAGHALDAYCRTSDRRRRRRDDDEDRPRGMTAAVIFHWLCAAGLIAGVWLDRRAAKGAGGRHWPEIACLAAAIAAVVAGAWLARPRRAALVVASIAVVLATRWMEGVRPATVAPGRAALRAVADEIWRVAPDAQVYVHDTAGGAPLTVQTAAELQMLLGRIVRWTPDPPPASPTGPGQTAVVTVHRPKTPTTEFGGAAWTPVLRKTGEKMTYELRVPAVHHD